MENQKPEDDSKTIYDIQTTSEIQDLISGITKNFDALPREAGQPGGLVTLNLTVKKGSELERVLEDVGLNNGEALTEFFATAFGAEAVERRQYREEIIPMTIADTDMGEKVLVETVVCKNLESLSENSGDQNYTEVIESADNIPLSIGERDPLPESTPPKETGEEDGK
jgi:hypothetical protein